jgi:hypothetical protein
MPLERIAEAAIERLLGRMIRRTIMMFALGLCALSALYQFTAAALLALESSFGLLQARLFVGAVYGALTLVALAALAMQRWGKGAVFEAKTAGSSRQMQLVMLIESAMLGYSLARKRSPIARRSS